jgi:hypothetical protein
MVSAGVAFLLTSLAVFRKDSVPSKKVTVQDLRDHMREVLIGAAAVGCVIVSVAAASIAIDIHQLKTNQALAVAELRQDLSSRLDSALWKFDTALVTLGSMQKSLATGITQVRVQVQQAQTGQEQAIRAAAQTTRTAVIQTLETAKEIQAAAPAPVVNVQAAKVLPVAPPNVVVNPVLAQPKPIPVKQAVAETPAEHSRWHWLRYLWPFHARPKD